MQIDRMTMAWLGMAVLVLSLLATQWSQWWATNLLTNFRPQLVLLGVVVLVVGVFWRGWFQAGIGAGIVVVNLAFMASQLSAPAMAIPLSGDGRLRVMTFNVLYSNSNAMALRRSLAEWQPDIVLLQEVSRRWNRDLAGLADLYPYRLQLTDQRPLLDAHGTVILSRFPVLEMARPDIGQLPGRLTAGRFSVDGHKMWLASTHLVKPATIGGQTLQRSQLADLIAWTGTIQEPLVLGGDFNSTLYTPLMEALTKGEGFQPDLQAGPWWQAALSTYPAWLPVLGLRIDHILARGATIDDARIVKVEGSDHRAVIADIVLPSVL